MGEPKMTAESLLGPVAEGDVVLDAAHFMGVLRSAAGSLLKYERYATLYGAPTYVADASACRVFVDRGRALRAIERVMARVAELEAALHGVDWDAALEHEGRIEANVYMSVDALHAIRAALGKEADRG